MWSAWHTNLSEMSFWHSSVITCQPEKGNLWYFFWEVLKMQTTKTLEDKNHVKPWNRAEASRWVRSSVPFYRAIWLNRRQGILWEGLGLSLPTSVNLNIGGDFVWLDVAKDICLILIHPETKVENFCWPPICCLTKSPLLFSCMLEVAQARHWCTH